MEVLVSEKEIKTIKKYKNIGNGKEGTCYLTPEGKIIKLFHSWYDDKKIEYLNLQNKQIAFPIDYLVDINKEIVGYTMHYLNGEQLIKNCKDDLELRVLRNAYLQMRLIILKLKDIYMDDLCLDNILFDYNKCILNLIDTSRWYKKIDGQIENISEFNWQIMTTLLNTIDYSHYKLKDEKELSDLYLTYKWSKNLLSIFLDFLNVLEKKVSEYKGFKVLTIRDLKL